MSGHPTINFALRHLEKFSKVEPRQNKIGDWSIQVYRAKNKDQDTLASLILNAGSDQDDDEENTALQGRFEYLFFVFRELSENDPVFVLSTRNAYKHIRSSCSDQFPKLTSSGLSKHCIRIQQVSIGQLFGPVSESSVLLQDLLAETVEQCGTVCRGFTAIYRPFMDFEGSEIKIKFKENGVVLYRQFSFDQYVQVIQKLIRDNESEDPYPLLWGTPGVPHGDLIPVLDDIQVELTHNTCLHLCGVDTQDWTFNISLSQRLYANAVDFRLIHETPSSGPYGGRVVRREVIPKKSTLPDFTSLRERMTSEMPMLNRLNATTIANSLYLIEYQSFDGEWYGVPLIDCVEGWISKPGNSFFKDKRFVCFKMGRAWYQLHQDFVESVQDVLSRLLDSDAYLLTSGKPGYLSQIWRKGIGETSYNQSYVSLNPVDPNPPVWFEGNQKFLSRIELFDILQISNDNHVFIYHVKDSFNNNI